MGIFIGVKLKKNNDFVKNIPLTECKLVYTLLRVYFYCAPKAKKAGKASIVIEFKHYNSFRKRGK